MPESPEVDALAGFIRTRMTGRRIRSVDLEEYRVLKTRDRVLREVEGRTVVAVRRFGKHIAVDTDGPGLLISFGRAGWASWSDTSDSAASPSPGESAPPVVARVAFDDDGVLALTDAGEWLSLGLSIVDDATVHPGVAKLGVDPSTPAFTRDAFERVVVGRRKQLKALLQEQESFAGIGNAYSDEILHSARLAPTTQAASLTEDERGRLYSVTRELLDDAFAARRDVPIAGQKASKVASMKVHGRTGEPCPVCGDVVLDVPSSKGAAQYCPTCQSGGVPLTP